MSYISTYLIYAIIPMLLGLWAQAKVQGAFSTYSKIRTRSGITGSQAARKMLDDKGLSDVSIERVPGNLTDHYDPTKRVLRLSEGVYDSPSGKYWKPVGTNIVHGRLDFSRYDGKFRL